jgi:hypothetical protein
MGKTSLFIYSATHEKNICLLLRNCIIFINVQTNGSIKEIFCKRESNLKNSVVLISLHEITPHAMLSGESTLNTRTQRHN